MSARLLEKLQELHTNGPAPYNHGICTQISRHLTKLEKGYLLHLMQQWPGRSGSINFPVPANRTDTSLKAAKIEYMESNTKQMWTATLSMVSCVGNCWSG